MNRRNRVVVMVLAVFQVVFVANGVRSDGWEPPVPEAYVDAGPGDPVEVPFWKSLNRSDLDQLVTHGIGSNFDVASARHRIEQAEAVARQLLAPLLPSVSAEAGYSMLPYNAVWPGIEVQPIPGIPDTSRDNNEIMHSVSTTLKASYLIDITGKNYTARQAALGDVAAVQADAETLAFSVAYLITQTYLGVVYGEMQSALVEEQIRTNAELLELVEARFDNGTATALDVLQQRQQLESSKSQLPLVASFIETSKNQLALLSGYTSVSELPEISAAAPKVVSPVPLGSPQRLLWSRPDLRAEAARVEASSKRTRSSFRSLLPSVVLSGQVGYQWNYVDLWDDGEAWGLSVLLSVPIWDGGRTRAVHRQFEAAEGAAKSAFTQKVRAAVEEVESAQVKERANREHYQAVSRQLESAETAFTKARERYVVGLTEYLNVLVSLGTYQAAQLRELSAHQDLTLARVHLQKALGGAWTRNLLALTHRGE